MPRIVGLCLALLCFGSDFSLATVIKARDIAFDYQVVLKDLPLASELKIWLPYLRETPFQQIEEVRIEPANDAIIKEERIYKNKIINFSLKSPNISEYKINVHYKVKRYEYSKNNGTAHKIDDSAQEDLKKYLVANRLITLSPKVREIAAKVVEGKTTTLEKARAIYDYVFENVAYDKSIPGWGLGDTERVCLLRAGNCTDFHSLFISLARASGIPAKFVMGVPLSKEREGEIKGYHCWAEFYEESLGWVPVDISEAWKDKAKKEYYFGNLTEDRLEFTEGRDIILEPTQQGEPLNYFVYPYVEIDGKVFDKVNVVFKYKDLSQSQEEVRGEDKKAHRLSKK